MIEQLDTPQIESVEEVGTYAKYEVGPFRPATASPLATRSGACSCRRSRARR